MAKNRKGKEEFKWVAKRTNPKNDAGSSSGSNQVEVHNRSSPELVESAPPLPARIDVDIDVTNKSPEYLRDQILSIRSNVKKSYFRGLPVTHTNPKYTTHVLLRKDSRTIDLNIQKENLYMRLFDRADRQKMGSEREFVFKSSPGETPRVINTDTTSEMPFDKSYTGILKAAGLNDIADLPLFADMLSDAFEGLFLDCHSKKFAEGLLTLLVVLLEGARSDPILKRVYDCCFVPDVLGHEVSPFIHIWGDASRYYSYWVTKRPSVCHHSKIAKKIKKSDLAKKIKKRISKIEEFMGILKRPTYYSQAKVDDFLSEFEEHILEDTRPLHLYFQEEKADEQDEDEMIPETNFEEALEEFESERVAGTRYEEVKKRGGPYCVIVRNLPSSVSFSELMGRMVIFGRLTRMTKEEEKNHAFVIFENVNGFLKALDASPLIISGNRVYIEEKRAELVVMEVAAEQSVCGGSAGRGRVGQGGSRS